MHDAKSKRRNARDKKSCPLTQNNFFYLCSQQIGDMTNKEILEMPIVQDHERLKKEFCRMWQQQEKLQKAHVLLIEMLSERNERIKQLEQELEKRELE